jgi:hypothetical protein
MQDEHFFNGWLDLKRYFASAWQIAGFFRNCERRAA